MLVSTFETEVLDNDNHTETAEMYVEIRDKETKMTKRFVRVSEAYDEPERNEIRIVIEE